MTKKLNNLTCRMIARGDLKEVVALHTDAFFNADEEEIARRVKGKKERAMVCVSRSGRIEGYVFFDCETVDNERTMYIANVGVRTKSRNKGVCGTMLPWLVKRLARYKCNSANLIVSSGNDPAIRCYESAGFCMSRKSGMSGMEYRPKEKSKKKKSKAA